MALIEKYGQTSTKQALSYFQNRDGAVHILRSNHIIRNQHRFTNKNHYFGRHGLKINEVVKVLEPIAKAILISEKNGALLSNVPFILNSLSQELTSELGAAAFLNKPDKNVIMTTI